MDSLMQPMHLGTPSTLGTLFTGDLVRLGALGKDSAKLMSQWDADAEFSRQLNGGAISLIPLPQLEQAIVRDVIENKEEIHFGIRTLADDKLIGFCNIEPFWSHRNAFVGIGIGDPAYRGKGYGTDAMRLLVGYGFRELDLQRIALTVFSYNPRAIRSYEKAGFAREVVERAALYRDGQRHDIIIMGILRRDWEAQQNHKLS
jgi:RimJ/RimL family protein N-acetyltransferase